MHGKCRFLKIFNGFYLKKLFVVGLGLKFNDYDILTNAGKVAHDVAKSLAEKEYDKFRITQDKIFKSDFENEVAKITDKKAEEKD